MEDEKGFIERLFSKIKGSVTAPVDAMGFDEQVQTPEYDEPGVFEGVIQDLFSPVVDAIAGPATDFFNSGNI